jgi:hypothetical protein
MDFNKIKTPLSCLIGSIFLMGIIYSTFFGVESIKGAIAVSMAFIAVMSWKIIYFILGSIILCIECMIFNKYERASKLQLNIVSAFLLLFVIICGISNYDAFSWKATLFGVLLYGLSRGILELKETPLKNKEEKYFALLILFVIVLALIGVLFADEKEFPHAQESTKTINTVNDIKDERLIEVEKIANKYEKQFKELGFISVSPVTESKSSSYSAYYTYQIKNFQSVGVRLTEDWASVKLSKSTRYTFSKVSLRLNDEKLFITGLDYDKAKISQDELAKDLDIVMEKIIMPKLKKMKLEIETTRDNLDSYKK